MLCAQAETSMELGTKSGKGGGWPRSRVYGTAVEPTVHSICESLPRTVARISLRTFCGPLNRSCPRPSMTLATKETSPVMRLRLQLARQRLGNGLFFGWLTILSDPARAAAGDFGLPPPRASRATRESHTKGGWTCNQRNPSVVPDTWWCSQ
jgi:hypothetical protein